MNQFISFLNDQFTLVRRAYNTNFTFATASAVLLSPACLVFLFFVLVLLTVSPYEDFHLTLSFFARAPYTLAVMSIYIVLFIFLRNFFFQFMDGLIAAGISFVLAAFVIRLIEYGFFWIFAPYEGMSLRMVMSTVGRLIIISGAYTTMFFLYAVRVRELEEDKSQLQIGGKYILIDSINSIESDDHYLIFNTDLGQNIHVRGRLTDVVNQLSDHGIQIHRSIWIAYAAIDRFETKNGALFIYTKSGEKHRVARPRQKEVLRELNRPLRATPSA